MIIHNIKLLHIVDDAPNTKTYYFDIPEDFTWQEGAHTHLKLMDENEMEGQINRKMVHHMSISTLPEDNQIGITTRVPGSRSEFKEKLLTLKPGDEAQLFKWGSRMHLRRSGRPIIMLSMGVGIATLRPVIHAYINDSTDIPFVLNVNVDSSQSHVFKQELDQLSCEKFQSKWVESRQSFYDTLDQLLGTKDAIYYVIGSDDFLKSVIHRLKAKNIASEDIVIDKREAALAAFFTE